MAFEGIIKHGDGGKSILFDGREARFTSTELATMADSADMRTRIQTKVGRVLPNIHIHRQRNGRLEIVVGEPVAIHYEDQFDTGPMRTRF